MRNILRITAAVVLAICGLSAPAWAQITPLPIESNGQAVATETTASAMASDIATIASSINSDCAHGNAITLCTAGPTPVGEAKDFDGAALPNVVTEGQGVRAAMTLSGGAFVFVTNEAGTKELGKLEDEAHATADYGVPLWAVRQDVQSDLAGDGDYIPLTVSGEGGLRILDVQSTSKLEDEAHASGEYITGIGARRIDVAASSASASGEWATLNVDALGRLWTTNGNPCADPARITSAVISESTAATNEVVALNGSDLIYVCGYKWVTTAANSLKWVRGTGADCVTGTTDIEGAQPYAANGGVVEGGGGVPLFAVTAGNALCLTATAATAVGGRVTYVRTAAP